MAHPEIDHFSPRRTSSRRGQKSIIAPTPEAGANKETIGRPAAFLICMDAPDRAYSPAPGRRGGTPGR